jgi:hypothetical protein
MEFSNERRRQPPVRFRYGGAGCCVMRSLTLDCWSTSGEDTSPCEATKCDDPNLGLEIPPSARTGAGSRCRGDDDRHASRER